MRYFKLFAVCLSTIFTQALYAQNFRTVEPQKDSVLIRHENGEEEVRYVFHTIEPERISDTTQVGVHPSATNIELQSVTPEIKSRSISSLSNYAVGAIPIQSGVTPTGGKTYSIPIMTAPGYNLVPNISLYYNSQSGNGIAGYGWSIAGLSSIEIRDKNLFYDNAQEGAMYSDPTACYSLDGVPIVKSENVMKGYELATAKGNIQIHKYQNNDKTPAYFEVLYPDGSKAVFGFKDNYESQISYPITEYEDIDGNKIVFEYEKVENAYFIDTISYGKDAQVVFEYLERRLDSSPYRNAMAGKRVNSNKKLLKYIVVKDGGKQLCQYTFAHKYKDNVNLLKGVYYQIDKKELPPIEFKYGVDNEQPEAEAEFEKTGIRTYVSAYTKSDELSLIYKRGWIIPGFIGDGMIELPNLPNYGKVAHRGSYNQYGSYYNENTSILINKYGYYSSRQEVIKVGKGFQIVEVIDVDGDGVDEIVKVNNSCSKKEVTDYTVTIYSYNADERMDSTSFRFSVNDGTYNKYFNNPAKSEYFFGNFKGDGKIQMLVLTRKLSKVAFIDLFEKKKLSEDYLFKRTEGDERYMFVADFEGKGKSDFCYLSSDGLQIYRVNSLTGKTFTRSKTYTDINQGIASKAMPTSSNVKCRSVAIDINNDGYTDIVSYLEATAKGVSMASDIMNILNSANFQKFVTI